MLKLLLTIASVILGIFLADKFVPGVEFIGPWKTLLAAGLILGLINFFIKPIIKLITLPIRFLTLGLFGLIINIAAVWAIDIYFTELIIKGIIPLLWATLIIWGLGVILPLFFSKKKNV
ncbi:MAG: phage holin family protein [Candidatus Nealsonbacteria bacterium]|nr:phage holin family protein [Candidatus Nealsonbacteria bacterium]